MPFSTSLSSKLARLWIAGTGVATSGANVTTWTDQITGDVATATSAGTASDIALASNTFGTYPSLAVQHGSVGNSRTLLPAAPVTGIYAAFGLVLANTSGVQSNFAFNWGSFTSLWSGGQDATTGIWTIDNKNAGVTCYQDGVDVGLCLNRRPYATVQGAVFPTSQTVYELCGANNAGSTGRYFGFGGNIGAIALLNAAPTQADITELTAYMLGLGDTTVTPLPNRMDLFIGDSRFECYSGGTPANANATLPGLVSRIRGIGNLNWQNFAVYGSRAAACLTTVNASVVPTIQAAVAAGIAEINCIIDIGINDDSAGNAAATTIATIQSICTACRTAGATGIAVSTNFSCNFSTNQTAYDVIRAALNTDIMALPTGGYADVAIPMHLDPFIGVNGAYANPIVTDFNADGVHLVAAGYQQQAITLASYAFQKQPTIPSPGLVLNGTTYGYENSWTGTGAGGGPNTTTLTITSDGSTPVHNAAAWITSDSAGLVPITGVLYSNSSGQVTFNLTTGNTYYLNATFESGGKITKVLSAVAFIA